MMGTEVVCPQCGASNGLNLADGNRLCFECRHEWTPGDELARTPGEQLEHFARTGRLDLDKPIPEHMPTIERSRVLADVLGPPASELEARAAQARVDEIIGSYVELEGGQYGKVLGFPDDDHVEVEFVSGDTAVVAFGDVVREIPAAPPGEPVEVDVDEGTALALAKGAFMVAGLALNAGLATLEGDSNDYKLTMPPSGWAPDDPDALPLFEQGVAYAIATLIFSYQLPRDIVSAMADTLLTDAQAEPTKGEG